MRAAQHPERGASTIFMARASVINRSKTCPVSPRASTVRAPANARLIAVRFMNTRPCDSMELPSGAPEYPTMPSAATLRNELPAPCHRNPATRDPQRRKSCSLQHRLHLRSPLEGAGSAFFNPLALRGTRDFERSTRRLYGSETFGVKTIVSRSTVTWFTYTETDHPIYERLCQLTA